VEAAAEVEPQASIERPELLVLQPERDCSFRVKALGLPAVSNDGRVIAFVEEDAEASELVRLDLVDIERTDRTPLADEIFEPCEAYERSLHTRVHALDAELRDYRAMQPLDVVVVDRERDDETDPSAILPAHRVARADRPVQAIYEDGWLTLRVPGMRVLSHQAHTDWRVPSCGAPHLRELWGDRESRTGVAIVDDACGTTTQAIDVPPVVFHELAQRPSERYLQLVDAACESVC
jgi:hypothetical protein